MRTPDHLYAFAVAIIGRENVPKRRQVFSRTCRREFSNYEVSIFQGSQLKKKNKKNSQQLFRHLAILGVEKPPAICFSVFLKCTRSLHRKCHPAVITHCKRHGRGNSSVDLYFIAPSQL